ncbi:MAG: Uma2 family endonuclease [Candidatus Azobacteroides sp.]|nr:Uma2 family endonuclease [Candidatus Azobacteroides sp.]
MKPTDEKQQIEEKAPLQGKPYSEREEEETSNIVQEPAMAYGNIFTYADYLSWTDDKMREIINGIVYAFAAPFRKHAKLTTFFTVIMGSFIRRRKTKGKCEIFHAPFDVRLSLSGETDDNKIYNVVQPDICVVCDPSKLDDRGCLGAPDLIVEVQSPSTAKRDLDEKFHLYERAGVREYWVVFPQEQAVTVFLLQPDGKYNKGATYEICNEDKKIPVNTLKGLVIDMVELFEE